MRYCATNRKVSASIPDGVTGILHSHNLFGRIVALGSTQPLTAVSTRNNSWGGGQRLLVRRTDLTTFMCRLFGTLGASSSWNPLGQNRLV
jgi:hypothetical protein